MHTWCVFSRRKIYRGNQGQILQVLSYLLPVAGRGHMHEPNCPRWCGLQYPFVKIGRRPAARPRRRHISRVGKYKYSSCSLVTTVRVVVALYPLSPCLISSHSVIYLVSVHACTARTTDATEIIDSIRFQNAGKARRIQRPGSLFTSGFCWTGDVRARRGRTPGDAHPHNCAARGPWWQVTTSA